MILATLWIRTEMTQQDAKNIILGYIPDCSKEETVAAWQFLVDDGSIWDMGRKISLMASCMCEAGTLERNTI